MNTQEKIIHGGACQTLGVQSVSLVKSGKFFFKDKTISKNTFIMIENAQ